MLLWLIIIFIIIIINFCDNNEGFTKNLKSKIRIFNFNTKWCDWSRKFQPEWDNFTKSVQKNKNLVHITPYDIKCDEEQNKEMCNNYQIPGYPYVIIEKDNDQIPYTGERSAVSLLKFIEKY
jgi:hypothetical protein